MNNFFVTILTVFVMLLYLIPGYILMKFKKVDAKHLKSLSTILVYVFSPCMIIDSFLAVERSSEMVKNMCLFTLASILVQLIFILILFLIFRNKYDDAKYRMLTIGSACGNVGFFGLPLIRAILPEYPVALTYSSIYVFTMNLIVFTIGSFCITRDKKYISVKNAILNPTTVSLIVAIILYACNFKFNCGNLALEKMGDAVSLLGKMTTPTCMIILGVRLACIKVKDLFNKPFVYLNMLFKLIAFPLFSYLLVYFLPLDYSFKASILILSAAPCASVVLNLAEMYDTNQEIAANTVLLTTLMSIITIPLLLLIL